jgi:hypothetical protein
MCHSVCVTHLRVFVYYQRLWLARVLLLNKAELYITATLGVHTASYVYVGAHTDICIVVNRTQGYVCAQHFSTAAVAALSVASFALLLWVHAGKELFIVHQVLLICHVHNKSTFSTVHSATTTAYILRLLLLLLVVLLRTVCSSALHAGSNKQQQTRYLCGKCQS